MAGWVTLWVVAAMAAMAGEAEGKAGDLVRSSDFRVEEWTMSGENGAGGMEVDTRQNTLRSADDGDRSWYFDTPRGWLEGDKAIIYNGTLEVFLQTISWTGGYKEDYDVVLVASRKSLSLGLKGMKKDGETSKNYVVKLNEKSGWTFYRKTRTSKMLPNVTAQDFIFCLNNLVGIQIRGGYYAGSEQTQLRSLKVTQGYMAGDELSEPDVMSSIWLGSRTCESSERFEITFNNGGLPCHKWEEITSGVVQAVDSSPPYQTFKLDPLSSSNRQDYYIGRSLNITGGPGHGHSGTIVHYVGKLDWEVSSGVTSVEIVNAGEGCQTRGYLSAYGGGGSGFEASFDVLYSIPEVEIFNRGVGCSGALQSFGLEITRGQITNVSILSTGGTAYITGSAMAVCEPPCTGSGFVGTCYASGGNVDQIVIQEGGSAYSAEHPPVLKCPEGRITAVGSEGGYGFEAFVGTTSGKITHVLVKDAGSSYSGSISLIPEVYTTCVTFDLRPLLSGYVTSVSVIKSGSGYTSLPRITISLGGGVMSGAGCRNLDLRAHIGDHTAGILSGVSSTSVTLGMWASEVDGYYEGESSPLDAPMRL
eukprot:767306-Hanusia_phi.AAC.3